MSLSMYQASIPVFIRQLRAVAALLDKGEGFAGERLTEARLAPDMHSLARQVHVMTDTVKGAVGRLAGIDVPSFPDVEKSFAELQDRIDRTIAFARSVPASQFEGSEDREITLPLPNGGGLKFTGHHYLSDYALPNFYFHATVIYAILRANGVPIGKLDYLAGATLVKS